MNAQEWQELASSDPMRYAQERAKELNESCAVVHIPKPCDKCESINYGAHYCNPEKVRIVALEKRLSAVEAKLEAIKEIQT